MGLMTIRARFVGLVAATVVAVGCGKSEGPGGGDNGTIAISVTPTSLSLVQGTSGTVAASITRGGGFTGTVTVVTEGAPTGVTAAVSNVTTTGTTTSGTVTVTVAATVVPGTHTLTVRASGSGVSDATTTFGLTVTAIPAIALTVTPTTVSVAASASGTAAVTIARTNFTGDVTLALEGTPAGVTGTFNPAAANGTTSTLTVQVGGLVTPGTYPLTIRGTGPGITAATTALSLIVTAAPGPTFDISPVVPDPKSLTQGTAGDVAVTLTRSNGFAGTVNLTLEGAPAGVTGAFVPSAVSATTSTLTLTVGGAVAVGNYTLTVRGVASGQADKTRTFVLAVAAVPASYTLTTTPTGPVTVQQSGATVNVTVNINRTNFTGQVNLAVTGNPAGLSAVLTPTNTTGNSVTMALSATTGVAVGPHTLTITGTATGLSNQVVTIGVNVTAPSGGSGNVNLDFSGCPVGVRPTWLAFQNGTGPWTVVTPTGNVYSFTVNAGKGGVAWVQDQAGIGNAVLVGYFSQAELTGFTAAQFCAPSGPATKSLTAQTANLGATQQAHLSLGGGTGTANIAQTLATLAGVQNGTYDLVAYAGGLSGPGVGDRVFIKRDVNTTPLTPGGSVGFPVDFTDATDSFSPATGVITVAGLTGGEQVSHGMSYRTGASCESGVLYSALPAAVTSFTAFGVPAGKQRGSDFHGLTVTANSGSTTFRNIVQYFGALGDRTVTLPSLIPAFTPSSVAGAYKTLRFQFTLPTDLTAGLGMQYSETATATSAIITATSSWLGGSAVDVTMPTFTGLAGWSDAWMPASAATVQWSVSGSGFTTTGACSAGSVVISARFGSL